MRIELENPDTVKNESDAFIPPKDEKRTFKGEIQKMKSLGFKDGFSYFWDYYRVPVIAIAIIIGIVISITITVIQNSRPYVIQAYIYNNYVNEDADLDALEQEFAEYEGLNLKDYQITFGFSEYFDPESGDENAYNTMMKVVAMISAKDIDVIGGNRNFVDYFGSGPADNVIYDDLEKVLPAQFFQYLKEQDRILYEKITDEDGKVIGSYAAAVEISNTRLVNENCLLVTPCYLGIAANTERQESAIDFLKWIFYYQG